MVLIIFTTVLGLLSIDSRSDYRRIAEEFDAFGSAIAWAAAVVVVPWFMQIILVLYYNFTFCRYGYGRIFR